MSADIDYQKKCEELSAANVKLTAENAEVKKKLEETEKNLHEMAKFHNETMQVIQDGGTDIASFAKARKVAPKQ